MYFSIYLTVYCLQFSERCEIRYVDNKMSTCTKVLQWAVNMPVTGFGVLSVSWWFVRIYLFKFGVTNFFYTSYVIEMKSDKFVARWVHCDVHL